MEAYLETGFTRTKFEYHTQPVPISEATGCTVLGKAEFLNPGGSVKDRAALFILLDAERRGVLRPGGTVVEGTAGNTGIGLALVANAMGFKSVIVSPEEWGLGLSRYVHLNPVRVAKLGLGTAEREAQRQGGPASGWRP